MTARFSMAALGPRLATVALVAAAIAVACVEVPAPLAHRDGGEAPGGAGGAGQQAGGGMGGEAPCDGMTGAGCPAPLRLFAGGYHTCAEMSDGTFRCWGSNDSHQLGDPDTPPTIDAWGAVAGLDADVLTLGLRHSCALADTTVGCWGRNSRGQLGTGDPDFQTTFTPVLDDASSVAASHDTTCAIRIDGSVVCWGIRLDGQNWERIDLGAHDVLPTPLPGLNAPAELHLGSRHGCAVTADRSGVACWGSAESGQLGDGSLEDSLTPLPVAGIPTPIHHLATGSDGACVWAGAPAQAMCWGLLPIVNAITPEPLVLDPQPAGDVVELGAGWRHACARLSDGIVQCWGRNHLGMLGSSGGDSNAPVTVAGVQNATSLAVGRNHNCALREDATVLCWGDNSHGQLGRDTTSDHDPVAAPLEWP